jgi:hypothetical protein
MYIHFDQINSALQPQDLQPKLNQEKTTVSSVENQKTNKKRGEFYIDLYRKGKLSVYNEKEKAGFLFLYRQNLSHLNLLAEPRFDDLEPSYKPLETVA